MENMIQYNYSNVELQKLIVKWNVIEKADAKKKKLDFVSKSPHSILSIETEYFKPKPYYYDSENESICVFGNPIINEKIDRYGTAQSYLNQKTNKAFLPSINGEFLIIYFDKRKNTLTVVNARFTSLPFY